MISDPISDRDWKVIQGQKKVSKKEYEDIKDKYQEDDEVMLMLWEIDEIYY